MVAIGERPVGQWSGDHAGLFRHDGDSPRRRTRCSPHATTNTSPLVGHRQPEIWRGGSWPNASPIGKKLLVGRFPGFAEVVGVAGDVKNNGLAREPMLAMYTPYPQRPWPAMQFAVRVAGRRSAGGW